ncbi:hypothetical protein GQ457_11G032830 [Hibiscus cannabinus]
MTPKERDNAAAITIHVEPQPDEPTMESKVKLLEDSVKDAIERLDVVMSVLMSWKPRETEFKRRSKACSMRPWIGWINRTSPSRSS